MASHRVTTASGRYDVVVERGVLERARDFLPQSSGKLFLLTTEDVWRLHGSKLSLDAHVLTFPGGEVNKRLSVLEGLAEQMIAAGADRAGILIAFGGGIVNDVGGFLAAVFMRGIPVMQIPTTLLAQVDAAIGGKTGVNLESGKNLVGSFHQPIAVLVDPNVLSTLPEREYRAGLFEVIKCGVIRSPELFHIMSNEAEHVLRQRPDIVDRIVDESVRIKAEVVSEDEKETDLRRILNFGHTLGHALEAETAYKRFLHGEAVGFGMRAAVRLAKLTGHLPEADATTMLDAIARYGPIPPRDGVSPEKLVSRVSSDKKTIKGKTHFVLPEAIGRVRIVTGIDPSMVLSAVRPECQ